MELLLAFGVSIAGSALVAAVALVGRCFARRRAANARDSRARDSIFENEGDYLVGRGEDARAVARTIVRNMSQLRERDQFMAEYMSELGRFSTLPELKTEMSRRAGVLLGELSKQIEDRRSANRSGHQAEESQSDTTSLRSSEAIVEKLPAEIRAIGLHELLDAIADGANDPDLNPDAWLRKNRWDVTMVRLRWAGRWLRSRIPGRRISK